MTEVNALLCPCFDSVGVFYQGMLEAAVSFMPVSKGQSTCDSGLQLCVQSYQVMVWGWVHAAPDFAGILPQWHLEPHRLDTRCFLDPLYAAIFVTAVNTSCALPGVSRLVPCIVDDVCKQWCVCIATPSIRLCTLLNMQGLPPGAWGLQ